MEQFPQNLGTFCAVRTTCPNCKEDITTRSEYRWGVWNFLATIYRSPWKWFLIPFWFKRYRDVVQICPKCQIEICHVIGCSYSMKLSEEVQSDDGNMNILR